MLQRTLFKITYQSSAEQHSNVLISFYLQILVNDRIISGSQLRPSTNADSTGRYYWYTLSSDTAVFVSRMAMVYLAPGTYSFKVGVKTAYPSLQLLNGLVHYELTQFDDQDQGDALGDLLLGKIPSN